MPETTETTTETVEVPTTETVEVTTETTTTEEPETFPREYVTELRNESAGYRTRARQLAGELWTARVAATGRLVNAAELPMPDDADPLDADQVTAAVDALLKAKPYLANRTPRGDIGQGAVPGGDDFSLAGILKAGAN